MDGVNPERVHFLEISAQDAGQRVDNFIRARYPGLPKSRIYQMLRKGEARRNGKRLQASDRLQAGDVLRLPPVVAALRVVAAVPGFWCERIAASVLFEDDDFLVLNKPAGMAVHGGSHHAYGVIDAVKQLWGERFAELAHRLDSETSGCLVLGKHRAALAAFREAEGLQKRYWCLVDGAWQESLTRMELALAKRGREGEERVVVDREAGKRAVTDFRVLRRFAEPSCTLMEALLHTGRTHQIRVSAQYAGHGIGGDEKYGDFAFNRLLKARGFRGMFLHARSIRVPTAGGMILVEAPLPAAAARLLQLLSGEKDDA
ncbi:MAG: pseudouridine synthase [Cardiobacteriaceae bacterium]|nr:pseudouridine synthase [Cardiobacteriaceae bacterium]